MMWEFREGQSFPRTRGDGPDSVDSAAAKAEFPPHTRGWTLMVVHFIDRESVSPAHAGMDLEIEAEAFGTSSFPRTRGDGPEEL